MCCYLIFRYVHFGKNSQFISLKWQTYLITNKLFVRFIHMSRIHVLIIKLLIFVFPIALHTLVNWTHIMNSMHMFCHFCVIWATFLALWAGQISFGVKMTFPMFSQKFVPENRITIRTFHKYFALSFYRFNQRQTNF